MKLFPQPKTIECPCCKSDIKMPVNGSIAHCLSCKSEVIAQYEYEDDKPKQLIIGQIISITSLALTFSLKHFLNLGLFSTLTIFLCFYTLLLILFRVPIKLSFKTEKPKITYGFVGGLSYPEQQIQKHNELIDWLSKATDDIIGFCRYISKSKYVDGVVDKDSLEFFQMLEKKTALLPANHQIDDWHEQYLSKDLTEIKQIKAEFGSEFELHIDTIIKLANQVEYFSDSTDFIPKEESKLL